jgi:predicted phosphate transport protein (TIGR00153 family)
MLFGKPPPPDGRFFVMFNAHGRHIVEGARAWQSMVQNYSDERLRVQHGARLVSAEKQADRITAECNRLLHKTFLTPIKREQIHGLINAMDDILDLLQDSTEVMSLYDLKSVSDDVVRLAEISVRCCERVQHLVTLLPQLGQSSMADAALKTCEEIDRLESDADRVMRGAMRELFRDTIEVRELIKLKAVDEHLESISDHCEGVANIVEGIVLAQA